VIDLGRIAGLPQKQEPGPLLWRVLVVARVPGAHTTSALLGDCALALLVTGVFVYEALGLGPSALPLAPVIALYVVRRLGRVRNASLHAATARLEREQADRTRLAVEQEQARIARELHDVVAHNVTVIVAQAGAAGRAFDGLRESEQLKQVLDAIERSGRDALSEMRRLLGVLAAPAPHSYAHAPADPRPRLALLPDLLGRVEQAGLPVHLIVVGERQALPAEVELCAYRIIQEALTNTLKHAAATQAMVTLGYHPRFLQLRVDDDGQGADAGDAVPGAGSGHGLAGMRQRAALLGGELAAGPGPYGGFRVTAKLPLHGPVDGGDRDHQRPDR